MGLKDIARSLIEEVFTDEFFETAVQDVTIEPVTSAYNASAVNADDAASETIGTTAVVKGVLDEYKKYEVTRSEGAILQSDRKLYIAGDSLTNVGATLGTKDTISVSGARWRIESVEVDPASALYIFQIRRV